MKYRGPAVTLLAVAALAAVLFAVNMRTVADTAARATASPTTGQPPEAVQPLEVGQPPEAEEPPQAEDQAADQPAEELATQAADPAQAAYAGRSSGNEVTIAIEVRGEEVAAYVCDGKQVESWLQGTISDGELTLKGNDAEATGAVQGNAVFGTVQVQGKQWPFAAQVAEAPAGLYEGSGTADGEPVRVGWIVRQDGSQVGVAAIGGAPRPAPAIDPRQLRGVEVGGVTIVPRPVAGDDDVVRPPS